MTTLRPRAMPSGLSAVGLRAANGLPIVVGTTLAVAYLLAPPMGADLSAQIAWAEVAERQWPALLDLRWYGGVNPLGYSVLAPPLMALLGVRLATAVGYLAGVVVVTALLQRVPVRRPVAGGVVAALGLAGNLASSRTTFVLGLAIALGALLAVAYHRRWLAVLLAVLTALTSPVAALFLTLAGVALALSGHRRTGIWLSASAAGPTIIVGLLFGNGGLMPFGPGQAALAVLASLIVVAACWDVPVVRWAALLSAAVVVVAYLVPNPVGSNAARLAELLAPAALVAVSGLPGRAVAALGVIVMVPQPLIYLDEVRARGEAALDPAFYAPLAEQLEARRISEPVEVVPMRRHGEAAAIAPVVPLARGWIRQVDVGRNGVFYDGSTRRRHLSTMARQQRGRLGSPGPRRTRLGGREGGGTRPGWPTVPATGLGESDLDSVRGHRRDSRRHSAWPGTRPRSGFAHSRAAGCRRVRPARALVEVALGICWLPRTGSRRVDAGRRRAGRSCSPHVEAHAPSRAECRHGKR